MAMSSDSVATEQLFKVERGNNVIDLIRIGLDIFLSLCVLYGTEKISHYEIFNSIIPFVLVKQDSLYGRR